MLSFFFLLNNNKKGLCQGRVQLLRPPSGRRRFVTNWLKRSTPNKFNSARNILVSCWASRPAPAELLTSASSSFVRGDGIVLRWTRRPARQRRPADHICPLSYLLPVCRRRLRPLQSTIKRKPPKVCDQPTTIYRANICAYVYIC